MLDRLRTYVPAFYRRACQSFLVRVINGSFAFTRARHGATIAIVFAGESSTFRRHSYAASSSPTFCVGMQSRGPLPYYPCCSRRTRARCSRPHCCAQWWPPCGPSRCRGPTRWRPRQRRQPSAPSAFAPRSAASAQRRCSQSLRARTR